MCLKDKRISVIRTVLTLVLAAGILTVVIHPPNALAMYSSDQNVAQEAPLESSELKSQSFVMLSGKDFNSSINILVLDLSLVKSVEFFESNELPVGVNLESLRKTPVGVDDTSKINAYWDAAKGSLYIISDQEIVGSADLGSMFSRFTSLESLDFSSIDLSSVEVFDYTFYKCSALKTVNLGSWNTTSLKSATGMFMGCSSISSLDLAHFSTPALESMGSMFAQCSSLKYLDLSGFDTSQVTAMDALFKDAVSLETLVLGDKFSFSGATTKRFDIQLYVPTQDNRSGRWMDEAGVKFFSDTLPSNSAARYVPELAPSERLYGDIALETMGEIVSVGDFDKNSTVIVTTSAGYWDALCAAGMAGMNRSPILMSDPHLLSSQTKSLLEQLKPSKILVCGGEAAISQNVLTEIFATTKVLPERISDSTATATAVEIFKQASKQTGETWSDTAFIATGNGYWDALSIAPYAYVNAAPIFLTEPDGSLSKEVIEAMRQGGIKSFYVCGGIAAVPDSTKEALISAGFSFKQRFAGQTAVDTSRIIANFSIDAGMGTRNVGVATVGGYWDALCAAALCGKNNSVLLLASDLETNAIDETLSKHQGDVQKAYVFGGSSAISEALYLRIKQGLVI